MKRTSGTVPGQPKRAAVAAECVGTPPVRARVTSGAVPSLGSLVRPFLIAAQMLLLACGDQPAEEAPVIPFREVSQETGLLFDHFIGSTGEQYIIEVMGSGGALLDYDNDGDLDVFLLQGNIINPNRSMADVAFPLREGQQLGNRLFRNELVPSGSLRFTDATAEAGLDYVGYGMGVTTGDYDNDGDVDLYVSNFGPNLLYENDGDGTFSDVTARAGVGDPRWGASTAFLDYDHDGDLDLMVANYVDFTFQGKKKCYAPSGELDYCTPLVYNGAVDKLWRNDGNGKWTDVSVASGIASAYGPGLGITTADYNGDGFIDIYVANDTTANLLWTNQGDGTFVEGALEAGVAYNEDGMPKAGMGTSFGDFDADGDEDLIVLNLRAEGCTLYLNEDRQFFSDVTLRFGLQHLTFAYTGFGVDWFDWDSDGWLDLFFAHGAVTIIEELRGDPYPFQQPNILLRNLGQGVEFDNVSARSGPAMAAAEVSRGAAFGDIDNDGDIDVLVTGNNGPARLLLNEVGNRRNWLMVKLHGVRSNRQGLGARVGLVRAGQPTLWRRCHTDSSYCSASDARVHFGLGGDGAAEAIVVEWPDGSKERWESPQLNTEVTLKQGTGVSD